MVAAFFGDTISSFNLVAFAANQQQNKTYTYKDMLKQSDQNNSSQPCWMISLFMKTEVIGC
eukprot:15187541-Ditylum_brightwellii.AAC.2